MKGGEKLLRGRVIGKSLPLFARKGLFANGGVFSLGG